MSIRNTSLIVLAIALFMAVFLSPFASSLPDGLERVAEDLGFAQLAEGDPLVRSPMPDYEVPALGEGPFSTAASGLIGTLICFLLPFGFYILRK